MLFHVLTRSGWVLVVLGALLWIGVEEILPVQWIAGFQEDGSRPHGYYKIVASEGSGQFALGVLIAGMALVAAGWVLRRLRNQR